MQNFGFLSLLFATAKEFRKPSRIDKVLAMVRVAHFFDLRCRWHKACQPHYYLCQGGYVFISVYHSVCLFVHYQDYVKPCRIIDHCYGKNCFGFGIDAYSEWPTGTGSHLGFLMCHLVVLVLFMHVDIKHISGDYWPCRGMPSTESFLIVSSHHSCVVYAYFAVCGWMLSGVQECIAIAHRLHSQHGTNSQSLDTP